LFLLTSLHAQFSEATYVATDVGEVNDLITADLNNDGVEDVIVCGSEGLGWYNTSSPDLKFDKINPISVDESLSFVAAVAGDIDNDGFIDIIGASVSDQTVVYYSNNGDDTFSEVDRVGYFSPTSLALGYIDGDESLDVAICHSSVGSSRIDWYPCGLSGFSDNNTVVVGGSAKKCVKVSDIDGDGDDDIIYSTLAGGTRYRKSNGDGTLGGTLYINNTPDGVIFPNGNNAISLNDLDNDGDLDFCVSSDDVDGLIYWAEQTELGVYSTFESLVPEPYSGPYKKFRFTDLNDDGMEDLLAVKSDSTLVWYPRLEDVSFGAEQLIATEQNTFVAAAINSSPANVEVVTGVIADLFLHPNDAGNFSEPVEVSVRYAQNANITIFDIDNDGLKDVVFSSELLEHIGVYRALGNSQ